MHLGKGFQFYFFLTQLCSFFDTSVQCIPSATHQLCKSMKLYRPEKKKDSTRDSPFLDLALIEGFCLFKDLIRKKFVIAIPPRPLEAFS